MRDVHLGPVEAAVARELRRATPPLDDLADVLGLHRLRRLPVGGRLDRGGPPEHAEVVRRIARRVQPEVVELGEDHRAVRVDGLREPAVGLERLVEVRPRDAREARRRGRVDHPVPGDQEAGAATGARDLVVDVALRVDAVVGEELDMGRLHDPVADGDAADPERGEEVRIGVHGDLDYALRWPRTSSCSIPP